MDNLELLKDAINIKIPQKVKGFPILFNINDTINYKNDKITKTVTLNGDKLTATDTSNNQIIIEIDEFNNKGYTYIPNKDFYPINIPIIHVENSDEACIPINKISTGCEIINNLKNNIINLNNKIDNINKTNTKNSQTRLIIEIIVVLILIIIIIIILVVKRKN